VVHRKGAPRAVMSHMKPYPDIVVSGCPDNSRNGRYVYYRQFNSKPEWKRYTRKAGRACSLRWLDGKWSFGHHAYTNKSDSYLPPATGWRVRILGQPLEMRLDVEHRPPISLCSSDEEEIGEITTVPIVKMPDPPVFANLPSTDEVFHQLLPSKSTGSPRGSIPRFIPNRGFISNRHIRGNQWTNVTTTKRNLDPPLPALELPPTRKRYRKAAPKKKRPPQKLQTKQKKTGASWIPADLLGQRLRDWAEKAPTEELKKEMAARLRTMGYDVTDELLP